MYVFFDTKTHSSTISQTYFHSQIARNISPIRQPTNHCLGWETVTVFSFLGPAGIDGWAVKPLIYLHYEGIDGWSSPQAASIRGAQVLVSCQHKQIRSKAGTFWMKGSRTKEGLFTLVSRMGYFAKHLHRFWTTKYMLLLIMDYVFFVHILLFSTRLFWEEDDYDHNFHHL